MVYTHKMARDSLHEDLHRRQEGRGSSDRSFGTIFGIFFVLVGLAPLRAHHPVRLWAFLLAGLFSAVGVLQPIWLRPLNKVWTKLGLLMGRVVSPVVTGLLFYLVVTPTGLLFRLFGKDPLRLAFEPGAKSYWIERKPPGPSPETMANQF
jgi:Saxitoxin biosynthesis operon protein SxtJ